LLTIAPRPEEDTFQMKPTSRLETVEVTADGEGLVSRAGTALLAELADRTGLTTALSEALRDTRERRSRHDPGRVLRDLALTLCDGGDCVADLAALRGQETLFGPVASETTAHRVVKSIDAPLLDELRRARAAARERAWRAGARPDRIVLDIDATLVTAHSEKEEAAGNWKGGFGFYPLLCFLDGSDEGLAGRLRAGNAGSNTAEDHVEVLCDALEQLPDEALDEEILVRTDIGGATHEFTGACRDAAIRFTVGYELTEPVRQAILALPRSRWQPAIDADEAQREGAWVAELTEAVELSGWPERTRLICRRERPHPGAQLSFQDRDGHRFTCFLTDQDDADIAALELVHRRRARVEDRIRCAKDTGLENLPFHDFVPNEVWLELVLIAQDLFTWAQSLLLSGELRLAEPKRLRQRLLHVAARIVRSGRKTRLRLPRDWPWAEALVRAFTRLRALPLAAPG